MGRERKTTILFITEAIEVHGDKYDYSRTKYIDHKTKVCVICPTHGEFWVNPSKHLKGQGCPTCGKKKQAQKHSFTNDEFVSKAKKVHGDHYDYSKTEYVNAKTKVCIICPIHGEFWQTPRLHLDGHQCILCYRERSNDAYGQNHISSEYSYKLWESIFYRCGNPRYKAYIDCSVCKEWSNYETFRKWFDDPSNGYIEGYQLDKDILVKGNREYSPDRCCFVPREINMLLVKARTRRGYLPIGVKRGERGEFLSRISIAGKSHHLGTFDTPEEAFLTYKNFKERYIKSVAERYFQEGKITKKVYDALMKYEVEITD